MNISKSKKGQTMVEYIIIVALIAIALIGVFTYFSRAAGKKVAGAASALSAEEGDKAKDAAENISSDKALRELGEN